MKQWLVAILILVIGTGMVIPCCGSDDCCSEEITANFPEDNPEGSCSPFFACGTCPSSAQVSKPIQLEQPGLQKQVHSLDFINFIPRAYISSFWQPPREAV